MTPIWFTIFVCINISVAIKNGRREGITLLANKIKLFLTATKLYFEKISKQKVNSKKNIGIIFLFNFKKYFFILNIKNQSFHWTFINIFIAKKANKW